MVIRRLLIPAAVSVGAMLAPAVFAPAIAQVEPAAPAVNQPDRTVPPSPPPAAARPSPATAAAPQSGLTDPQIAHIAYTAGEIDIKTAKLALQKSRNAQVRAYANDMVRDHTAVNKKATALLKKLKVKPQDNDTSRSLSTQGNQEYDKLKGLRGADFDREYAQNEANYHHTVNTALQDQLIPSAQNAELKSLLQQGLQIFQGHEQHAQQLVASLK